MLIAQRWILACIRNRTFFSLDELNAAIAELLEKLNETPFQKLERCRRSAFEELDRPALKLLPGFRYERADWEKGKVHVDYHVEFDDRFYSVPCALIGAHVEVRATTSVVEVLLRGQRVASHTRAARAAKDSSSRAKRTSPSDTPTTASGRPSACSAGRSRFRTGQHREDSRKPRPTSSSTARRLNHVASLLARWPLRITGSVCPPP